MTDQLDCSQVTPQAILKPHLGRTIQPVVSQDTILAVTDRSDLRFATRPGCEGPVIIGQNQTSARRFPSPAALIKDASAARYP